MAESIEGNEPPKNREGKTKLIIDWLTNVRFWITIAIVTALAVIFVIPILLGEIQGIATKTNDANSGTISLIYGFDFLPSMFNLFESERISPYMFHAVIIAFIVIRIISAARKFYVAFRELNIEEQRVKGQLQGEKEGRDIQRDELKLREEELKKAK